MTAKSDWLAVHQQLTEEEQRRLGDPPTVDEMLAYSRGELSGEKEERVRALLVAYPALARALTEPFPVDGGLPDAELDRQWASMQQRIHGGRVFRFPAAWTALAAALALVFAGLYWQAESKARRLTRELSTPRAVGESTLLLPEGQRGVSDGAVTVITEGDVIALRVPLIGEPRYTTFRLEIRSDSRVRWRSNAMRPDADSSFLVFVPREFLSPGKHQIVVYGVGGSSEERIESYVMRVR
ncbi:MAG TPA: hypothetical protein VEK79_12215 [Thermoanaerobaculia bacterium]|nr:hypothetical protein [Thermoanaerobaculia bacterium]